ncbi:hypothetical protein HDU78_000565, partial [Chytriomyces hyalinus]
MSATTLVPKGQVLGLEWDESGEPVEVKISEVPEGTEIIPMMEVYSVKNHKDLPPDVVEKYK